MDLYAIQEIQEVSLTVFYSYPMTYNDFSESSLFER
jgi:hypothetical protein